MQPSTKKAIQRLKQLASEGDKNIFERIQLAASVVADDDYLSAQYKGGQDAAIADLEGRYFKAIGGLIRLHKLLAIYREFPQESRWAEYRYDIKAMSVLWDDRRRAVDAESKPAVAARRRVTVAEFDELQGALQDREYSLKVERERGSQKEQRISELENRVRELEQTVSGLRGELRAYSQSQAA